MLYKLVGSVGGVYAYSRVLPKRYSRQSVAYALAHLVLRNRRVRKIAGAKVDVYRTMTPKQPWLWVLSIAN